MTVWSIYRRAIISLAFCFFVFCACVFGDPNNLNFWFCFVVVLGLFFWKGGGGGGLSVWLLCSD